MSTTPTPVASPTTLSSLQTLTLWIQSGNAGDSGGPSATAPASIYEMTPGNPAVVTIAALAGYADAYLYMIHADPSSTTAPWEKMTQFRARRAFAFPSLIDSAACQGIEFETQKVCNGLLHNMAAQVDFLDKKTVNIFDYNLGDWQQTYIPSSVINMAANVTNTIDLLCSVDETAGTTTHIGIVINGIYYPLNIVKPATKTTAANYLHSAIQLDSNAACTRYVVEYSDISLQMQATGS